jgi:hypothetical protein
MPSTKQSPGNPSPIFLFAAWTWRGHLLDLLCRRDEALSSYRNALDHDPGSSMEHSQYHLRIDRAGSKPGSGRLSAGKKGPEQKKDGFFRADSSFLSNR